MEITENQNKAVNEILDVIVDVVGKGSRELNTLDAIATSSRLAGSFLFRSFEFEVKDAEPGSVMLSEDANTKGPMLVNLTHAVLQSYGIEIDNEKMPTGEPVHAENSFVEGISQVQSPAYKVMKNNELSFEQMAQSAAIATAFIIQQSKNITPEEGFSTAIYHYIEGTKTQPPAFPKESEIKPVHEERSDNKAKKEDSKPWWKFW